MPTIEILMPAMGEGIIEATLVQWLKNEGDTVSVDENIVEVATDKVNSEVPSSAAGVLVKKLYKENDVIPVGKPFAIVSTDGSSVPVTTTPVVEEKAAVESKQVIEKIPFVEEVENSSAEKQYSEDTFYSPLVLNIAKEEGISTSELNNILGTGQSGRVTKKDILAYVQNRTTKTVYEAPKVVLEPVKEVAVSSPTSYIGKNVEIIEMDRMRKLIADHMVNSKKVSPHVSSFVEVDMTNVATWRNKMKKHFLEKEGENLTFMPFFVEAVAKALKDFPIVNSSVDGDKIIIKKDINIGIAAALPSGNLIVPVIKNANELNLLGLTKRINDLANRARQNKLKPDETQGGTYTISNLGTFGNILGTPIINQPQVAILAVGAIKKRPVVIETPEGDSIGIRQMMYLSHSYDHRVIDGFAGGSFVKRVADYLETFDIKREL